MDAVVATSPAYAQTSPVLQQLVSAEQLKVIPLGMNDALPVAVVDGAESIVARLGLTDQPFILSLGVLRYYKGLHVLVEAARHTRGTIVLAGSGPEDQNLRQQVARLGLDNVVFAGQVSETEKHELLSRCTALALPSHLRSEAYGMVLLEAAMHSKPQISCDIGTGTSFINQHLETGFVVPPEDPESLAAAMNRLISDAVEARAMGHRARQRYEQHFTGAIMARSYAALYQSVTPH
jgi:rhamnosyl/mannosyltransferase